MQKVKLPRGLQASTALQLLSQSAWRSNSFLHKAGGARHATGRHREPCMLISIAMV